MNKAYLKKLITDILKFKTEVILICMSAIFIVASNLAIPFFTGRAVDTILAKGQVDFKSLYIYITYMLISVLISTSFQFILTRMSQIVTCKLAKYLRGMLFAKIQKLDFGYIDSNSKGYILSRIVSDTDMLTDGLYMMFVQFITGSLSIILTIAFMLYINPIITLLVILLTPLSILIAKFMSKKSFDSFLQQSKHRDIIASLSRENIYGLSSIYLFNREKKKLKDFEEANLKLAKANLDAIFFSSITFPSTRAVNAFIYALISILGAFLVIAQRISIGNLSSFLTYAQQYTKPFNEISGVITELSSALVCAKRIYEFMEEDEFRADDPDSIEVNDIRGDIELDKVSFSYDKNKEFIKDLSLFVKSGMKVAIVGPTGCGKSTLINLLMRFYEIDKGSINMDGYDIRKIKRQSLLSSYGMVLQDTWLKSGTIRENIAFGKSDASLNEITEVSKACMADSFISRMPLAYDTYIDKGASNLSLGQRQLICIARIMLSNPPILILDEATSSIDARTELKVKKALDKLMKDKTSFIVAHRLSTIKEADIILLMRDGRIVEAGNHNELLKLGGFYTELYNSQYVG